MAVNTITGLQVLVSSIIGTNDYRASVVSARVNNAAASTITCAELEETTTDFFKYATVYIPDEGVWSCAGYNGSTKVLTLDNTTLTSIDVGDSALVALYKTKKRMALEGAIKQAMRASYWRGHACWYREVILDLNNNLISDGVTTFTLPTLSSDAFEYALPSDCAFLAEIGVQDNTSSQPRWMPRQNVWRTHGGEGAKKIRFDAPHYPFNVANAGKQLCLRYEAREPVLTTFTASDTTQLPEDFFQALVPEIYNRRSLATGTNEERSQDAISLPQQQLEAQRALSRIGILKPAMQSVAWGFLDGD